VRGAVFAGGTGSDRYVIGPGTSCAGIFEAPGEGTDRVETARCLRGAQNVEQIALTGSSPLAITTGDGRQTITGNAADNVIDGGAGSDVMNGGAGTDTIHLGAGAYDTATGGLGADRFVPGGTPSTGYATQLAPRAQSHRLTDFSAADGDRIVLRAAAFGREVRALRHHFVVVSGHNPVARSTRPTILNDPRTGLLAFDRDGSGLRGPRVVAMVPVGTPITPGMFEIR
jgi:Ca2+-binding RTX toxin-like protein